MKYTEEPIRGDEKLVMLPGLEKRLLTQAMSLVEEKKYREAREQFGQLLDVDIHNEQALYGWAVCSVELGDYSEAEEAIVRLLKADTPYYYDVFRLYLTILIERKDYATALHEMQLVMQRKHLPDDLQTFLQQMQNFCAVRMREQVNSGAQPERKRRVPKEKSRYAESPPVDWAALEKAEARDQALLIHNLSERLRKTHLPEIKRFLLDDTQHAEIKTLLLCAVKEGRLAKALAVRKFGQIYHAELDTDDFLNKGFADQMEHDIRAVWESDNPTMAGLAIDMGRTFTMNVYPRPIVPDSPEVWAALFCLRALNRDEAEEREAVLKRFAVPDADYARAEQMLRELEAHGLWL